MILARYHKAAKALIFISKHKFYHIQSQHYLVTLLGAIFLYKFNKAQIVEEISKRNGFTRTCLAEAFAEWSSRFIILQIYNQKGEESHE